MIISSVLKIVTETLDSDFLGCQLEKFQEEDILATFLHALVLPLSLGIYKILRGWLPSPGGDTAGWDFILFGTRQKPRDCWQGARLYSETGQTSYRNTSSGRILLTPLQRGYARTCTWCHCLLMPALSELEGSCACFGLNCSPSQQLGEKCSWHKESTQRETSPTWLLEG